MHVQENVWKKSKHEDYLYLNWLTPDLDLNWPNQTHLPQSSSSMEEIQRAYKAHCLVLPFPTQQGHINPMLQFSKLLHQKGVKVTLVTTIFDYNTIMEKSSGSGSYNALETISDGYDQGGIKHAQSVEAYLESLCQVGLQTLAQLLVKLSSSGCPVDCIVYDAFLHWPLDVAKKFGIFGAIFFTQSCAVNNILYHVYKGELKLPLSQSQILLPGLPPLVPSDMPSYVYELGTYPAVYKMLVGQFPNVEKADWVLCNTFYELEEQVRT